MTNVTNISLFVGILNLVVSIALALELFFFQYPLWWGVISGIFLIAAIMCSGINIATYLEDDQ